MPTHPRGDAAPILTLPSRLRRSVAALPGGRLSFARIALVVALLTVGTLLLSFTTARAQTLELGASGTVGEGGGAPGAPTGTTGGTGFGVRLDVGLLGASVADTTVDLRLAVDRAVQLGFSVSANQTFVPLGNVIFEASGALRTDGRATGRIGGRGVLGPVALGLELVAFNADASAFDPLAIASAQRPAFGHHGRPAAGWGVALTASGRPARPLVIEVAPALYRNADGTTLRFDGRLRWLRAVGDDELSLRLSGADVAAVGSYVAVGAGYTVVRRRAPKLDVAAFVGRGPLGWRPGLTADLGQRLGAGIDASLQLSLEPYRTDVAPYRAHLSVAAPTAIGQGTADLALGAGATRTGAALRLGLRMPVELPAEPGRGGG